MLREGDPAPDFTARVSTGETLRLSDFRGSKNVVLSFYPKDFSPGCTRQLCSYRDAYARIQELDAVLLGVSTDTEESHRRFAEQHNLPFPLISDPDQSISRAYGAQRIFGGVRLLKRVTYVIDTRGVVRCAVHHEIAVGRHLEDVLAALETLKQGTGGGR